VREGKGRREGEGKEEGQRITRKFRTRIWHETSFPSKDTIENVQQVVNDWPFN
jgi:hypothetical protein